MPESKVTLDGDRIIIDFPYIPDQVTAVKRVPGARWDRVAKVWIAPLSAIHEARRFAQTYGFDISDDLANLDVPERTDHEAMTVDGNTIWVTFPYDEVKVAGIRRVSGARWNAKRKAWKAHLASIPELVEWANHFNIPIPEEISNRVNRVNEMKSGLYALSTAKSLGTPLDTSRLAQPLYDFQHVGVEYALRTRRCFIADTMGLGKTVQAIAASDLGGEPPVVVVCPPTLILNWVSEINRWVPGKKIVTLSGMAKKALTDQVRSEVVYGDADIWAGKPRTHLPLSTKNDPGEIAEALTTADFIVLGYSTLNAWRPTLEGVAKTLIFDESQYLKNKKSQRTKAAIKLSKAAPPDSMILCLTGTPVLNRPAEFASQLAVLGRISEFGGEWAFYKRYCDAFKDKWGQWHIEGSSNREELNEKLRSTCYVRRLKEDVLGDLAPIRHQVVPVDGTPKVMAEYHKAEEDIANYLAERAREIAEELGLNPDSAAVMARIKANAAEHIVRLSTLRRLAALAKMEAIEEIIKTHVEEGSKVVVAAHHRDVVSGLADRHGGYKIQGGMAAEEVEKLKARFQEMPTEDVPVMVLSIQAAKTGHTLTAAQHIIMAELPWTPADADQVIGRLHRIGQEGSVLATWILVNGTVDETIYAMLQAKRKVVDAVTEGGVDESAEDLVGDMLVAFARRGLAS